MKEEIIDTIRDALAAAGIEDFTEEHHDIANDAADRIMKLVAEKEVTGGNSV